jgi:hypothetical protein
MYVCICILLLYFCFQILVIIFVIIIIIFISLYFIINKVPGYFFQSHIFQYSIHTCTYSHMFLLLILHSVWLLRYISFNLLYLPGVPSALVYVNLSLNTFGTTLYMYPHYCFVRK